jgi:hypothetical protein
MVGCRVRFTTLHGAGPDSHAIAFVFSVPAKVKYGFKTGFIVKIDRKPVRRLMGTRPRVQVLFLAAIPSNTTCEYAGVLETREGVPMSSRA